MQQLNSRVQSFTDSTMFVDMTQICKAGIVRIDGQSDLILVCLIHKPQPHKLWSLSLIGSGDAKGRGGVVEGMGSLSAQKRIPFSGERTIQLRSQDLFDLSQFCHPPRKLNSWSSLPPSPPPPPQKRSKSWCCYCQLVRGSIPSPEGRFGGSCLQDDSSGDWAFAGSDPHTFHVLWSRCQTRSFSAAQRCPHTPVCWSDRIWDVNSISCKSAYDFKRAYTRAKIRHLNDHSSEN